MDKKKADVVFYDNGTVADLSTGLMWMLPLVGQGWNGSTATGTNAAYIWNEATERYGRGRLVELRSEQHPFWKVEESTRPRLNQESYKDYQLGAKKYEFAGFSDWRMPIVEEVFTFMEAGVRKEGGYTDRMCTANPSTTSLYERMERRRILRRILGNPYPPDGMWVWEAHLNRDIIFGDHPASDRYWVRLVRLGYLFQATH